MTTARTIQRRAPRLPVGIPGQLGGRLPNDVTVLDVSQTGCLVRSPTAHVPGAILDLTLSLEGESFSAKVCVRDAMVDGDTTTEDAEFYLVGLQFLGLPVRQETRLRTFLRDRRRAPRP